MNLGDIDDRTVNQCLKSGEKLKDFTTHWEEVFFQTLDTLRITRAQHYPRASEHVGDMVEQTRSLLEKGLAYEKLRSVYFRINSCRDYGKLSGIEPKAVRSETSTTYDYYEKDNPQDFALFKRPTLAELKAGISWPTPWGSARPGWHVECSSMAIRYLGQPIDIHTASTDLTFPHGDNEIAIGCGLSDKPLANFWMHSEVVMAGGKKVSRAAGNDLTLGDLMELGFDGTTVRYWLLATHYRTVLKYTPAELERAAHCVARLNEFVARLQYVKTGQHNEDLDQMLYEARMGCQEAMDHDLSVSKSLGILFAFVRHVNRLINAHQLDKDQADQILGFMRQVNQILDIIDFDDGQPDLQVKQIVDQRDKVRSAGDFERADSLRDQLQSLGWNVTDSPAGTRIRKI